MSKNSQQCSSPSSSGLIISKSDIINSFLIKSSNTLEDENLRKLSLYLSSQPCLSYQSLKSIWLSSNPSSRPSFSLLFSSSSFIFTTPKPRQKSEELKERLKKLEELAERKAYAQLVKDITPKENQVEPFSSYKDQLGFGLHVVVTMFSGYLVGFIAFRALFNRNPIMSTAGGIVGLVCAMLVETLLFIIRTSDYDNRSSSSPSSSTSKLKIKKNQ